MDKYNHLSGNESFTLKKGLTNPTLSQQMVCKRSPITSSPFHASTVSTSILTLEGTIVQGLNPSGLFVGLPEASDWLLCEKGCKAKWPTLSEHSIA